MKWNGIVLALLTLAATGCATAGLGGNREPSQADVRELKARVLELQRQARVDAVELERLRRRVAALEAHAGVPPPEEITPGGDRGTAGEPSPAVPSTARRPAPAQRSTAAPSPPPDRRGQAAQHSISESDLPVEQVPPPVAPPPAESRPIESQTRPPSAAAPATHKPIPVRPDEPAASSRSRPVTAAAQALYDRGYTLYHQGQYADAEASFQRFLGAYGDTDLADNAQYWIGEARLSRGDLRGALAAFRQTIERYPEGNKVPDALLKAGQTLERLGDQQGARASYLEVSKRFPSTGAAAVAEERLQKLP